MLVALLLSCSLLWPIEPLDSVDAEFLRAAGCPDGVITYSVLVEGSTDGVGLYEVGIHCGKQESAHFIKCDNRSGDTWDADVTCHATSSSQ